MPLHLKLRLPSPRGTITRYTLKPDRSKVGLLIHKRISLWLRTRLRSHGLKAALAACALLVVMPLIAGCSRQGLAQAARATATASAPGPATVTPVTAATVVATNAPATPQPGLSGTPGAPSTPRPT